MLIAQNCYIVLFGAIISLGSACNHQTCTSNKFQDIYISQNDTSLVDRNFHIVDFEIKKELFNNICSSLSNKESIIIAEATNQFSYVRRGLVYIRDNNEFYSFQKEKINDKLKINK